MDEAKIARIEARNKEAREKFLSEQGKMPVTTEEEPVNEDVLDSDEE